MPVTTQKPSARWPTRDELLAWGLVPCAAKGCRVVVNPDLMTFCGSCRRKHHATRKAA